MTSFHESPTPARQPRPHRPLSDWAKHRCLTCGESFGGPTPWKAAERFFTHPRHRACIERWYPIVDVAKGPLQAGGGVRK